MDPFQKFPFYVLLKIVKSVPGLPSLFCLLHASPTVSSLFQDCALEIFHAVVQESIPSQIQPSLYTIAYIRSDQTASHGLCDFISKIGTYHVQDDREVFMRKGTKVPSSTIFREVLMLACHVQQLGQQCLHEMIYRCVTMNISHMDEENANQVGYDQWIQNPIMHRYQPQNSGSPSWMEENRVYRALWRLQLFFDLQQAARENRLKWSLEDIQKALSLLPEEFWDPMQHELLEELRVVKECVRSLYPNWSMLQLPIYRGRICYNQPTAVLEGEKDRPGWPRSRYSQSEYLGVAAHGYWVIKCELEMVRGFPLGFPPFRRYGLALWDRKRLMALELMGVVIDFDEPDSGVLLTGLNQYFTWRSLLSEEEIEYCRWKKQQILDGNITYRIYTESN